MVYRTMVPFALLAASAAGMAAHAQPSFTGLGGTPGSVATDVSGDGKVVVGWTSSFPYRWTREEGAVSIASPDGSVLGAKPYGISGDGNTITGNGVLPGGGSLIAIAWESTLNVAPLPGSSGSVPLLSNALSASHDGNVIAGFSTRSGTLRTATLWRAGGERLELGTLPGHSESTAYDVSADGTVAIGYSDLGGGVGRRPVIWTEATGMQRITLDADAMRMSVANTLSPDGKTVGGSGIGPTGGQMAAIWTEADGVTLLGPRPAGTFGGGVFEMSADANVLGINAFESGTSYNIALIWTPGRGQERLIDVLKQRCGLDLTGWRLSEIGGISADGRTIVGTGVHDGVTEAFVAVLCEPVVCPAEYNGALAAGDILDFLDFLQDFAECTNLPAPCGEFGDPDINDDLMIDILDFLDFMEAFGEGC